VYVLRGRASVALSFAPPREPFEQQHSSVCSTRPRVENFGSAASEVLVRLPTRRVTSIAIRTNALLEGLFPEVSRINKRPTSFERFRND